MLRLFPLGPPAREGLGDTARRLVGSPSMPWAERMCDMPKVSGGTPAEKVLFEMSEMWQVKWQNLAYNMPMLSDWTEEPRAIAIGNVATVFEATAMGFPIILFKEDMQDRTINEEIEGLL